MLLQDVIQILVTNLKQTPWGTVLHTRTVKQLVKTPSHFGKLKGSLHRTQELVICLYPDPDKFRPRSSGLLV